MNTPVIRKSKCIMDNFDRVDIDVDKVTEEEYKKALGLPLPASALDLIIRKEILDEIDE